MAYLGAGTTTCPACYHPFFQGEHFMDSGRWTYRLMDDDGKTATGYQLIKPNGNAGDRIWANSSSTPEDLEKVVRYAEEDVRERNDKSKQRPPITPPQVQGKRS
jgi:hypothetical protein